MCEEGALAKYSKREIEEFEAILARRLAVFEAYRKGERQPETSRAKHFLEVLDGRELPKTRNERAYLYYLAKIGRPVVHVGHRLPKHMQANPLELNRKMDDAQKNMAGWKPWHD